MSDEARPRRFPRHDTWKGRATRFLSFSLDIGQNRTLGKFIIIIIISIITFVVSIFAPFPCQTDSLPMRYDSPKPHQFFPGVQVLSQASNITGIRSRSEASIPAAGSREPFAWRARPHSLRCCIQFLSLPFPCLLFPPLPFPFLPFPFPFNICLGTLSPSPVLSQQLNPFSQGPQNNKAKQRAT